MRGSVHPGHFCVRLESHQNETVDSLSMGGRHQETPGPAGVGTGTAHLLTYALCAWCSPNICTVAGSNAQIKLGRSPAQHDSCARDWSCSFLATDLAQLPSPARQPASALPLSLRLSSPKLQRPQLSSACSQPIRVPYSPPPGHPEHCTSQLSGSQSATDTTHNGRLAVCSPQLCDLGTMATSRSS